MALLLYRTLVQDAVVGPRGRTSESTKWSWACHLWSAITTYRSFFTSSGDGFQGMRSSR